ncbi:isochorismatase family protein [Cryobacterium sp.]|jgi:maleamate amidohydrolase|uniref:isochorismatase family protein n=1 Tax=Cryobacterium sp. TaxID=1926290 RepID=UPI00261270F5|nr:isochorismatase family protein [Cryobacterium sp.]MCU1446991.1 N-carbamoylsarcosine amidase [Cryobacterium sp.]
MTELAASIEWNTSTHVWDEIVDEPMRAIYSAYQRPLGITARPAVLAIDLYNKVFAGGDLPPHSLQDRFPSSCGAFAHAAVEPIYRILTTARELDLPVIHLTASRSGSDAVATNRQTGRDEAREGDPWEFHRRLAPVAGEVVVQKERASAFYGTQLLAELVMRGVDSLIVVGESTSGCVRASVVDGYSNGFHMTVVEDGVFDRSWLNHQVNLFDLHHKYADVIDSSDLVPMMRAAVHTRELA